jgi:tripartite-type tricarboxylate transporter receptor subunit TctC
MPLISGQTLRALAVASATRAPALPAVPTTTEFGFANSDYEFWVGAFAPAATPRALVDRLNGEIVKALATENVRAIDSRRWADRRSQWRRRHLPSNSNAKSA